MLQKHQQRVQDLESQVEQHKQATETVSQQLVSKIRQLKAERARAELAESKIPPLVESIAHLKDLQKELQSSLASVEAALAASLEDVQVGTVEITTEMPVQRQCKSRNHRTVTS